jgi:hypothetical protein
MIHALIVLPNRIAVAEPRGAMRAPDEQQMCKFLISAALAATISWASPVCLAFAKPILPVAAGSGPANSQPSEPGPKPDCWQGSTGHAHCNV